MLRSLSHLFLQSLTEEDKAGIVTGGRQSAADFPKVTRLIERQGENSGFSALGWVSAAQTTLPLEVKHRGTLSSPILNRLTFVGLLAANLWGFVAYRGIYCSI